jgi:hypothetical protein
VLNAESALSIFDCDAHPDIFRPRKAWTHSAKAIGAFGEYLETMPRSSIHYIENTKDEIIRDFFMKKVAHRIHKNNFWKSNLKTVCIIWHTHSSKPSRHPFGIAVYAAGANLGTSRNGVPG